MTLEQLNALSSDDAHHQFMQCCTSEQWVQRMVDARPFQSIESLHNLADSHWQNLDEADYLQAFEGHPKIGDITSLQKKYANTKALAAGEQSSVSQANEQVIARLAKGNTDYEEKFGFIFIVCATGKSAAEMTDLLENRLVNDRSTELMNAAEEQRKIFHIRLEKLL